jgi:hypothetical protein
MRACAVFFKRLNLRRLYSKHPSLRELRLDGPHFKVDMPLAMNPAFDRMNSNLVETTDRHSYFQSIATLAYLAETRQCLTMPVAERPPIQWRMS